MQNLDKTKQRYLGIGLILLGIFMVLRLWWLVPVVVLGSLGVYIYMQRRREGRIAAAVQSGLWLMGLALLLLFKFFFLPGVLLLGGASLLLRGREGQADQHVVHLLARFGIHLPTRPGGLVHVAAAPMVPTGEQPPAQTPDAGDEPQQPVTGKTTRL